jgi:ABC-type branched-subunit amino acid transport system substrate-binding protein
MSDAVEEVGTTEPFLVGYLDEGLSPDPAAFDQGIGEMLRFRFAEALDAGEVDRPIELVVRRGRGLPHGTAKAVRDAWNALADEGVLVIIGPGITDNCMAVVPLFESRCVPTINFPGTTRSRGRYGFHYQIGALYGDGPLIARAIGRRGLRTVAVIRDRSPIGSEYFEYFEEECERSGLTVVADLKCSPVAANLSGEARFAAEARPDALAYLGFGGVLLDLSRALTAAGWDPPRFTTTAGMHFYSKTPAERREMSGWVYVDMVDDGNETMRGMLDAFEKRHGRRPFDPIGAGMYDMATLAVLGIRYATVHTPEGVMEGLERISQVPAALGGAGTIMGFGPWERTALKGPDYLVLRQMRGTETVRYQE